MPKISLKSEAASSISEHEVVSALQQIMNTSANDSARVTAATRLLDFIERNKAVDRFQDFYGKITDDISVKSLMNLDARERN